MSLEISRQLDQCCSSLESHKITNRKHACNDLIELLRNKNSVVFLNDGDGERWTRVLVSIQHCLETDAAKANDDARKKGAAPTPRSADLFSTFIRIATKENAPLQYNKLLHYILETVLNPGMQCYHNSFAKILSGYFLSSAEIRSGWKPNDWTTTYSGFKTLCEDKSLLDTDTEFIRCLAMIMKWGPVYNFPVQTYRNEFDFITTLTKSVSGASPKPTQEAVLELILEFSKHVAKDNRIACCELGEGVLMHLLEFYDRNMNDDKMKARLVEFFLLQVALHHPGGVKKQSPASYAISWTHWKKCLMTIYEVMVNEIEVSLESTVRNQAFIVTDNGEKRLMGHFVFLFVEICNQLFDRGENDDDEEEGEERPRKRQKLEIGFTNLIGKLRESKSWMWLNLIYPLLDSYPETIGAPDNYLDILKTVSTLQVEAKDPTLAYHTLKMLITLEKIGTNNNQPEINQLWQTVAKTSLRSNQNDPQVQILIRRLITNKILTTHENIFANYFSERATRLDVHNLKTVEAAFKQFTHLQLDTSLKSGLMRWILNSNNLNSFRHCLVAEVLVNLTLKQWADTKCEDTEQEASKPFQDIEDVYLSNSLEKLVIKHIIKEDAITNTIYCHDQHLFDNLVELLADLTKNQDLFSSNDNLLSVTVLIYNVLSYMISYELLNPDKLQDFRLFEIFTLYASALFANLDLKQTEHLKVLTDLFKTKISSVMSRQLVDLFPEELIRDMFEALVIESNELQYKKHVIEILVAYACDHVALTQTQTRVLEALIETEYNCACDNDYELVVTLIKSVIGCQPKTLTLYDSIFNLFRNVCEARYHCCLNACEILEMFHGLYPYVPDDQATRGEFVQILYPFYMKIKDYGPGVAVMLLKCMNLVYETEPNCKQAKWANEEIVLKVPEFLTSDHQEVRYAAIANIARFFEISTETLLLEHYHRQEIMFAKVTQQSLALIRLEDEASRDEITTRTSTILQIFASIIITSELWVDVSLYNLLKTSVDSKFSLVLVAQVVNTVGVRLGFKTGIEFLEKHLISLLNQWKGDEIARFPFTLVNCANKLNCWRKYWNLLAPLIIDIDRKSLDDFDCCLEDVSPKLFGYVISQEVTDVMPIISNPIHELLRTRLGIDKFKSKFSEKIERIFLTLVDYVRDETHFHHLFQRNVIFPRGGALVVLKLAPFRNCLQFVETTLSQSSLFEYLGLHHPDKVHGILLALLVKLNGARGLVDKLLYFHHYSITLLLCVELIPKDAPVHTYVVRTLTHSLLHLIKNHRLEPELSWLSCKLFKLVLTRLLPSHADTLKQFLLVIVSRLKNLALEDCPISDLCVEMLQLLIINHGDLFVTELEKLDSIPKTAKFAQIYSKHFDIKYSNRKVTLEDEIKQFLEFGHNIESYDECEHSLKHLKMLLSSRKPELKALYEGLKRTRGFSEDCQQSSLHKLICMLITLSSSSNKNVSTEAVRCLGEIGPADLNTLILQPEKPMPDSKLTSWEQVLGHALLLLSKYLVDRDVNVIGAASQAVFCILKTKEGRKVADEINYGYLYPFITTVPFKTSFNISLSTERFMDKVASDRLWIPSDSSHDNWVTNLCSTLLGTFQEQEFFATFINVCLLKVEFSEQILPFIVYAILDSSPANITNLIAEKISSFFTNHWEITVLGNDRESQATGITVNKSSVQCMLNVVHFIRLQRSIRVKKVKDLNLDYLRLAKAAHFCTAHFTALLYTELWCQQQGDDHKLEVIYEQVDEITANALQNILRQAYKAVGEIDAALACGTSFLFDPLRRVEYYKEQGKWSQAIHHYDVQVSHGLTSSVSQLVDGLNRANLYQLALLCSKSLEEPDYESLWRLGRWDYNKSFDLGVSKNYDKYKYHAFKALHDDDEFSFNKSLDLVRLCIVRNLHGVNLESSNNFYSILAQMQSYKEIEDFARARADCTMVELLEKWTLQDQIVENNFQYVEPVKSQRMVLLNEYTKNNQVLRDTIVDWMLDFAGQARVEGSTSIASRTLGTIRLLPDLTPDITARLQLEEAQLCWSFQDDITAKGLLRQLCTDTSTNDGLKATALKITGTWMVETSSENRQTIIEDYFQRSLDLFPSNDPSIVDTYHQLAKFTDFGYQQVMSHIKSDIFQRKKANVSKAQQTVQNAKKSIKKATKATKDIQRALVIKDKQSRIDLAEIENKESEKDKLLELALKYYLLNLIKSDDHNITIFRLISLLLENRNSEVVKPVLTSELIKIPSYKFIDILPQIIPHISGSTPNDLFSTTINKVIEKCAKEHPYHTLPLVIALALSNKDREYSESKALVNDARMQSAKAMLTRLKRDPKLSQLIAKMLVLSEALIELAYYKGRDEEDTGLAVPKKCKIRGVKNYDDVLLPTYTLPVDKSGNYHHIIGIASFGEVYNNVGGINAPKRITCRGTDGIERTQLVKGQDDLRQDAVMQQVFTIMNSLLAVNKQTKNLLIRTYKIVPLSMRSGVLEWVKNTMPIGEFLTGKDGDNGAHIKYRPSDRNPKRCRVDFKNAGNSLEEKLRVFNKICNHLKPVFHKFFEVQFPQPTLWYERRRAYIHSVATTSMCGYILGIGDRHLQNILIDKNTAEVVHIDFGIAFEQGLVLPTPETVPFRLTRDIVDGMGVSGVEGVFRKSCEKTMNVLRMHQPTILTILEVLLYDPLYDWTVSSAEANKRQKDEDDSYLHDLSLMSESDSTADINVTADRALLRLSAKLQGTEDGNLSTVEHQVATLIQQAVDPANLCRLFNGWQPYL